MHCTAMLQRCTALHYEPLTAFFGKTYNTCCVASAGLRQSRHRSRSLPRRNQSEAVPPRQLQRLQPPQMLSPSRAPSLAWTKPKGTCITCCTKSLGRSVVLLLINTSIITRSTRHSSRLSARYLLGVPQSRLYESLHALDTNCTQGVCADRASAIDTCTRRKTPSHYPTPKPERSACYH